MSRPIFEPAVEREMQKLGWGTRQLSRRPSPVAAGAVVVPYSTSFETADDSRANNNVGSIFDAVDSPTLFDSNTDVLEWRDQAGANYIQFNETGIYEYSLSINWTTDFDGEIAITVSPFDEISFIGWEAAASMGTGFTTDSVETDTEGLTHRRSSHTGHIVCIDTTPQALSFAGFVWVVANISGSLRVIDNAASVIYQVVSFESGS